MPNIQMDPRIGKHLAPLAQIAADVVKFLPGEGDLLVCDAGDALAEGGEIGFGACGNKGDYA